MVYFIYNLHSRFPILFKLVPCIRTYRFINNARIKFNLLSFFHSIFSAITRVFNFNTPCAIKMLDLSSILNRIHAGSPANSNQICILGSYEHRIVWEDVSGWGPILARLLSVILLANGYLFDSFCIIRNRIYTLDVHTMYKALCIKRCMNWKYHYYRVWNLFKESHKIASVADRTYFFSVILNSLIASIN